MNLYIAWWINCRLEITEPNHSSINQRTCDKTQDVSLLHAMQPVALLVDVIVCFCFPSTNKLQGFFLLHALLMIWKRRFSLRDFEVPTNSQWRWSTEVVRPPTLRSQPKQCQRKNSSSAYPSCTVNNNNDELLIFIYFFWNNDIFFIEMIILFCRLSLSVVLLQVKTWFVLSKLKYIFMILLSILPWRSIDYLSTIYQLEEAIDGQLHRLFKLFRLINFNIKLIEHIIM